MLQNKKTVEDLMRIYKNEKIESMNYIFGKPYDNKYFTKAELQATSKINLFDRKVLETYKNIWEKKFKEVRV